MADVYPLPLRSADKTRRDLTIIAMEIEDIHARLAHTPTRADLGRTALGIILCTAVVTTFLGWWLFAH
jgi:hypothetical protein